jgi:hypothetical protein
MTKKEKYILLKCVKFAKEKLGVTTPFKLKLSEKREGFKTTGYYDSENHIVAAYTKNRAICDVCRTLSHEIVHHFDNSTGRINGNNPDIGKCDHDNIDPEDVENRANALSGAIVKEFSYKLKDEEGIDIYNL